MLRQHLEDQDAERQAAGAAWEDWDLVWCQPNGRPADPHVDWEDWKALLKEAGITKTPGFTTRATPAARCSASCTWTCT